LIIVQATVTTGIPPAPPRPTRPPFSAYRLPTGPRRGRLAAIVAFSIHLGIIIAIFWGGAEALLDLGAGGPGPRGGGGGDGGAQAYFTLPASPPPAAVDISAPPQIAVDQIAIPEVKIEDLARIEVPQQAIPLTTATAGTGTGGPGQGPGSGGGTGSGIGTGTGSDVGPGTGGGGGDIFPAKALGLILPANCFRGRATVRFWVAADGRVTRVDVDPPPRDRACRQEMTERMMSFKFLPATTRDGQPIASIFPVSVTR
jgi:periplasmic protein TonB